MPGEVNPTQFDDVIVLPIGSATTPSIHFSGDTSSGIYSSVSSVIDIQSSLSCLQGSETTPSIWFSGDTSIGIWSSETSIIEFGSSLSIPRGSATTPAIIFSGDTSVGFYSSDGSVIDVPSPLSLGAGSATTPAISFSGHTNTGCYSSDTSTIDWQVGSDGTFAIHSVLSVTTLFVSVPSSATTGSISENQLFFTINPGTSGLSFGVRSGDTIYYIESNLSTTAL